MWIDREPTAEQRPGRLAELADPAERAHVYAGRSAATIKAYAAGWRDFLSFCELRGVEPLPASDETVGAYLADMAGAPEPQRPRVGWWSSRKRTRPPS